VVDGVIARRCRRPHRQQAGAAVARGLLWRPHDRDRDQLCRRECPERRRCRCSLPALGCHIPSVRFLRSLFFKKRFRGQNRLPHAVLRAKFDDIAAVIGKALQEKSEVQPIMRSALDVLTTTLKAQDGATWTQATTRERLRWLAMFILDPRPKVCCFQRKIPGWL